MSIHVLATDEYKSQEYDAVLVRENTVVCVKHDVDPEEEEEFEERDGVVRSIPLSNVNHIDADPDLMLAGTDLPDWFYGGGKYGFVVVEDFPDVQEYLEDLERETA